MKKIFLPVTLIIASGLAAPRSLSAESGLVFDSAKGSMTGQLNMGDYAIISSSAVTAAYYQINGSTMAAVLPGIGSIAYGVNAGSSNITGGDYNIFIGNQAGASNITGDHNTANGYQALYSNTTGGYNTANGYQALYSNTIGDENTANGWKALYFNATGGYNTANGRGALYSNTLGGNNTANGYQALYSNAAGDHNTATGYKALFYNQTGSANSVLGAYAGGFGAGGVNSFSSSTMMGYKAGYNLTAGSDNVLLGFQAGDGLATGARNIIVGYDQDTSAPGASNELNIGGVLYGDLSAKTIGISTRVPQAALDIVSTGTLISQYAQIWRNSGGTVVASMTATGVLYPQQTAGGGSDNLGNHIATMALDMNNQQIMNVSSLTVTGSEFSVGVSTLVVVGGNVGIGTASPGAKLDVQGGLIKASGGLVIETRADDPGAPVTGQIWVVVP